MIVALRRQGLSILLSEQNAQASLAITDRGYVIDNGRVILCGTGNDLLHSSVVAERYLGVGSEHESRAAGHHQKIAARLRELIRA